MTNMILAFDVGNTNIVLGGIDESNVYFLSRLSTHLDKTDDEYAVLIKSILDLHGVSTDQVDGCIISSVVPPLVNTLKNVVMQLTGQRALVVGPGIKTGLRIAVGDPSELGADLVVAAVAALAKYKRPMVVLDLGTATTFSVTRFMYSNTRSVNDTYGTDFLCGKKMVTPPLGAVTGSIARHFGHMHQDDVAPSGRHSDSHGEFCEATLVSA